MANMNDVINEFISLKGLHLCELVEYFHVPCTCDWCAYVVDELMYSNLNIRLSRSCTKIRDILNQRTDFITVSKDDVKKGDIVLYDWDETGDCDHVGIICEKNTTNTYVIEGNINSTDFTKSTIDVIKYDAYRKKKTTAVFRYIGECDTTNEKSFTIDTSIRLTECDMKRGHWSDKFLCQALLKNYGYYNGEIDGDFGPMTLQAIKGFQSNHNINISGIVDCETWKTLIDLI